MMKNMIGNGQIFQRFLVFIVVVIFSPLRALAEAEIKNIDLVQGTTEILDLSYDVGTILVGDESIADIVITSADSLYVFGKKTGVTNVQILDENKELFLVVNVSVGVNLDNLSEILLSALPGSELKVQHSPGGVVILGWVNSTSDRERAVKIASSYTTTVVDAIKIRNQRQVYVQVRFVEISSIKTRELGGDATFLSNLGASKIRGFAPTILAGASIDSEITALLDRGEARYLAAPTLTALVGTTSSFLAGGEIPVVSTGSDGQAQTEFKEYGVRLSFTPTINDNGAISLTLEPEVSQVDETRSTPSSIALTTRRAKTTTEVQSGETIMLAGMLQSSSSRGINSIPGLGEMPIIGPLFRNARARDAKTELVILVKPMLSKPDQSSIDLKRSIEGKELTDGREFFIDGKLVRPTFSVQDVVNGTGINGAYGHILDADVRSATNE